MPVNWRDQPGNQKEQRKDRESKSKKSQFGMGIAQAAVQCALTLLGESETEITMGVA